MRSLNPDQASWIYNGLDCCVTLEVYERLREELDSTNATPEGVRKTYRDALAKQAPYLEMSMRGIRIDEAARKEAVKELRKLLDGLEARFQRMVESVFGHRLNWRSPIQLKTFFYGELGIKEIKKRNSKGVWAATVDEQALERLKLHFYAEPFARYILAMREIGKKATSLETDIDPDGRIRCNINIAGTDTGRLSSSRNDFGTGTNLQNVDRTLRAPFIADPKMILVECDLEQADSRNVGAIIWNRYVDTHGEEVAGAYLDACESGDLHTTVARMAFAEVLPWGDDPKGWRAVADTPFTKTDTYRDGCKKLGHGCLTAGHEVLTPSGWVDIATMPPVIMEWGLDESRFVAVKNWTSHNYTGILQSFEGTSISALMTHDHRVPFKKDAGSSILHEKPAEAGPGAFMPLGGGYVGGSLQVPGALIAAVMSDGELTGNRTRFNFRKPRKVRRLLDLCARFGVDYNILQDGRISIGFSHPKKAGKYMLSWAAESAKEFLEEYVHWDGHRASTSQSLFSKDREHLEWIQTLGRLHGIGGNLGRPKVSGFGTLMHTLQQNRRQYATGSSVRHVSIPAENVPVFCPTVESGWFYVRKGGKIFVTGNTNYYGQPTTMAKHTGFPSPVIKEFQGNYFRAFPLIQTWHKDVIHEIKTFGVLTTLFGRRRFFFGRGDDQSTWRAAIAYEPQSMTGHEMDMGIIQLWRSGHCVELLQQVHDSILFQVPWHNHQTHVEKAIELLHFRTTLKLGREFCVPLGAKAGWNWGGFNAEKNPYGLAKWKGEDKRQPPVARRVADYF